MADVVFDNVTRIYAGAETPAVDALELEIADGELVVLVGPSGCGKSTTLRMLAGLEGVDGGEIRIGSHDVTHVRPKDRDIAMVFQEYALYPHMTVEQNIGFHLKIAKVPRTEIARRVTEAARMLDLTPYLQRKPGKLSGGQRQRVAMGRAIVREPQVFLMDEPLSNLDAKLRVQTRTEIAALQRRLGVTTVYVTHDQVEAMTLGDRVAVLDHGVLQQFDRPRAIFDRPANTFVAGFMGSPPMNLLGGRLEGEDVRVAELTLPTTRAQREALTSDEVTVGVRTDAFVPAADGEAALNSIIELVEDLGSDAYAYCMTDLGGAARHLAVRVDPDEVPDRGAKLRLRPRPGAVHLFDGRTGDRLPD
ncbi:sn-glycerol-3-phosphate ABC transporter ATP-binding protein UgpC [Nocardioides sp. YIM 152315]|uniref:ABC transporter ATP-binding protein n=1 Tax=Nocardioides sp. YIM 152315 TaxID=3031760 RepID=UPI0023DADDDB|nr:sn-glycerol-3-phosphate ABC transporter ATP-binding protein UgpC [Nocardioides sp. YIM 152315]MDF1602617.1 sn-glycerol-3-phosphate ABC transporter ATP-binding protein UgpC [Nocardioides sp. YIM 152315]